MFTTKSNQIFSQAIADYHRFDKVDMPIDNPYKNGSIEYLLYLKNWIDTVQWHLEDIIRDPHIDPEIALKIKRRIDRSNQERTDMVEYIDSYFLDLYKDVRVAADATVNTESPAWAIDQLLEDIAAGRKYMKVYKQMKMYNDPELNPVLYASK